MLDCRLLNGRRVLLCAWDTITCPMCGYAQEHFRAYVGRQTLRCRYGCEVKAETDPRAGHLFYRIYNREVALAVALRPADVEQFLPPAVKPAPPTPDALGLTWPGAPRPDLVTLLWIELGLPLDGPALGIQTFFEGLPRARRLRSAVGEPGTGCKT